MFRIASYTFLWVLVSCSTAFAQKSLTIATFNCEFLTKPKVHLKYGLPFNLKGDEKTKWSKPGFRDTKLKESSVIVAKVIAQMKADIVALIEVGDRDDVNVLEAELATLGLRYPYSAVALANPEDPTKQHVAVLSKFELTNVLLKIPGWESYLREPDDPESESRTDLGKGMRVTFRAHDHEFMLYAVHLKSERGGHESDVRRISQASIVRRHMLKDLNKGKNIIIAGDLNDYRGQPTLNRIRGLDDIYPDLVQTGYVKYFEEEKLNTRWTYEYQGVYNQIDHVLLSDAVLELCRSNGIRTRTFSHDDPLASDHKPLIVTLELR